MTQRVARKLAARFFVCALLGPERYGGLLDALDQIASSLSQGATLTKTMPWDVYLEDAPAAPTSAPAARKARRGAAKRARH